jgi:hypothetical protein
MSDPQLKQYLSSGGRLITTPTDKPIEGLLASFWNEPSRGREWKMLSACFHRSSGDYALTDEKGQVFYCSMGNNLYHLVRSASSLISAMEFVQSRQNQLVLSYEQNITVVVDTVSREIIQNVQVQSEGVVRMMRTHPRQPLLALATDSQVVSKEKDDSLRTTVSNKMITNASDEQDTNTGSDFYKFSSVALEGTSVQITIQDAPRTNIFWYRAIVMMFSLIATIVLGSSRYISFTKFSSNDAFSVTAFRRKLFTSTEISMCQFALQINTAICDSRHLSGYFDMRPYQAVMGIAILVFIHSVVFTAYYILPVDENENKYVPGMQSISIRDTVY